MTRAAHSVRRLTGFEAWFVLVALLWLLAGPRIAIAGGAGVRYEDLLFVALAVIAVRTRSRRVASRPPEWIGIAAVTGASLLSAVVAWTGGRVELLVSVLYAIRPLEYWMLYPAIMLLLADRAGPWPVRLRRLLALVTVLQTVFAVLQFVFHLDVGFSHQAYSRGAGLTAGPYELGAISAALLIYWAAGRQWWLAALATFDLVVSISRISLVGAALGLVPLVVGALLQRRRTGAPRARRRPGPIIGVTALVAGLAAIAALLVSPGSPLGAALAPVTERFGSTSVIGSWEAAAVLADRIPPIRTAEQYDDVAFVHIFDHVDAADAEEVGAEASNLVRFFRWHLILDTVDAPDEVLLGLGPSFVGGSVDGSYLRFYADGGVLGVLAWLTLIVTWFWRAPRWMVGVIISILIGAVFIDIVYSLRTMVLMWTLLAIARNPVPVRMRSAIAALRSSRSDTAGAVEERAR